MLCRAAPLFALLLPLLAACTGRSAPELTPAEAFARLPEEIGGFHKAPPEGGRAETAIASYTHPNRSAGSIHALPPTGHSNARDGEDVPEISAAVESIARATVAEATARRENVTLRHIGARVSETGPIARCLDVQFRGEQPRRQLGCATLLDRRVFVVMMVEPEAAERRRGARDPLLALTLRLIGTLSGLPLEPVPAEEPLPLPPQAAPPAPAPAPKRPAPARPRLPALGPAWKT
jgi:hypothetical protein